MLHGRFRSRCRKVLQWSVAIWILACVIGVLETALPASPRWVLHEERTTIGYAGDGRSFLTASRLSDRPTGPLEIRDVATGQVQASFFPDALEVQSFGVVPTNQDALLIGVLPQANAAWELHLLNLSQVTLRQLEYRAEPGKQIEVKLSAASALASVRQFTVFQDKVLDSELCLVDLAKGAVLHRWKQGASWTEPSLYDTVFFTAHTSAGKWTSLMVDLEDRKVATMEKDLDDVRISTDKHLAVTIQKLLPSRQCVKLWDLRAGVILTENVLRTGEIMLSADARWAILAPQKFGQQPLAVEFWNLIEKRKLGELSLKLDEDWFEVTTVDGRPLLMVASATDTELTVRDADTFEPLWKRSTARSVPRGAFDKQFLVVEMKQGKALVALDNTIEAFDLLTGELLRTVPLVSERYFDPAFGHSAARGRPLIVIAEFRPLDRANLAAWRAQLEDWLLPERRGKMLHVSAVVDLDAGRMLFARQHFTDDLSQRCWLSKDGKSVILSYVDPADQSVIECWDVPARKPWLWIVGMPMAAGMFAFGAWALWRHRRASNAML